MLSKIKELAAYAIKLQNKGVMESALREITALCEPAPLETLSDYELKAIKKKTVKTFLSSYDETELNPVVIVSSEYDKEKNITSIETGSVKPHKAKGGTK